MGVSLGLGGPKNKKIIPILFQINYPNMKISPRARCPINVVELGGCDAETPEPIVEDIRSMGLLF